MIRSFNFFILILFFCCANFARSATITLRDRETKLSDFTIEIAKPFEIEIFVDADGQKISGLNVFLSFDPKYVELIDAEPAQHGLQPINPIGVPDNWQIFDNDTHGDPDNKIDGFQIDYVHVWIGGDQFITEQTAIAILKFRPIHSTDSTEINFDFDTALSRLTEATVIENSVHRQIGFTSSTPARIEIVGGPVLTKPFPEVAFLRGESATLPLRDHVFDTNDPSDLLDWVAVSDVIEVEISPDSHVATFREIGDFWGYQTVKFFVTDPDGNRTEGDLRVRVMTAPTILDLPAIQFRIGTSKVIDLNDFFVDLDTTDLSEVSWHARTLKEIELDLNVKGSLLTVSGDVEQFNTPIELTATDVDGHAATQTTRVSVLLDSNTLMIADLPEIVFTVEGDQVLPIDDFTLDDYVFDIDFGPDQIMWSFNPSRNFLIEINAKTRQLNFFSRNNWTGTEEVTLVAENPNGLRAAKMMKVTMIQANAPPILSPINDVKLLTRTGKFADREVLEIDLKSYVFDYNTPPDRIQWQSSQHDRIQIKIDFNGIATIFADTETTELVTITAIDPDENRATTDFLVTVVAPKPPQISTLSDLRLQPNETVTPFRLDDFVVDRYTPIDQLQWRTEGFDPENLAVEIDANRNVKLIVQPNWHGEEIVIFTATNELQLSSSIQIAVIGTAEPSLNFGDEITEIGEAWQIAVPLADYVVDPDTSIENLIWSFQEIDGLFIEITDDQDLAIASSEGAAGEYEIQFVVTDPDQNQSKSTFHLIVNDYPKTPPTIALGENQITLVRDQLHEIQLDQIVFDTDTQFDQLRWSVEGNDKINAEISKNLLRFSISDRTFFGAEEITLIVSDPELQSDRYVFTISVPFPPIIEPLPEIEIHQRQIDQSIVLNDFVSDLDTPITDLQFSFSEPVHTSVEMIIGDDDLITLKIQSIDKKLTAERLTLTVTDPDQNVATQQLVIRVTQAPPIQPPEISILPDLSILASEIREGKTVSMILDNFVSDPDTDQSFLIWDFEPSANVDIEINPETRIAIFLIHEGFVGEEIITLIATDPDGKSDQGLLKLIVIDDGAKPPKFVDAPTQISFICGEPDTEIDLDNFVEDPDTPIEDLTFESTTESLNLNIEIDPNTKIIKITPSTDFNGSEIITFRVVDPQGFSDILQVLIFVQGIDTEKRPPAIALPPEITLRADQFQTLALDDFVVDPDTPKSQIIWEIAGNRNIDLQIDQETRIATIKLSENSISFRGKETIEITARDRDCGKATAEITVTILEPPDQTPPKLEIFVLQNPIQSDFLTIIVSASEILESSPKLTANGESVELIESTQSQTWQAIYVRPKDQDFLIEFIAKGRDLAGLDGSGSKVLNQSMALAPETPPSFLSVTNFPNPAIDHTVIRCTTANAKISVSIFDVRGKIIKQIDNNQLTKRNFIREFFWRIDDQFGQKLASGIYFCHVTAEIDGKLIETATRKIAIR